MARIILLVIIVFYYSLALGQSKFNLNATIVDGVSKDKLPFATLTLLDTDTKKLAGGGVSDENGFVKVESNFRSVIVQVDYIGYETYTTTKVLNKKTSLGIVALTPKIATKYLVCITKHPKQ